MKKTIKASCLFLTGLFLASCSQVEGALPRGLYNQGNFEGNYYTENTWASRRVATRQAVTITSAQYANGAVADDAEMDGENRQGAKSLLPSIFLYTTTDGSTKELSTSPLAEWTIGDEGHDDMFIGDRFGRTKCLATSDASFKKGILSKLYNGQMFCNGYHSLALAEADKDGFGDQFAKTASGGSVFLASFRGGSTYGKSRFSHLDLTFSFYFEKDGGYVKDDVTAKDVIVSCDAGGENDTFFAFDFKSIGLSDISGLCGYSLSYSNVQDNGRSESFSHKEKADNYWGLLIYEVMFPDSTWR